MLVRYHPVERFPGLAWICEVNRAERRADLHHGRHVETHPAFFVEGLWGGGFEDGRFDESESFFGSGAVVKDQSLTFVSSCSTTDSLYYKENGPTVVVSNSLPLLLARLSDGLDPARTEYRAINESINKGIYDYAGDLPTVGGSVRRLLHMNLTVDGSGCSISEKPMPPEFRDYSAYASYLVQRVDALMRNARSAARRTPMRIFSTQSRGYDTTAVNAIAARFGLDAAFTVQQAKASDRSALDDEAFQDDDDGTEICEALGIRAVHLNRRAFAEGFADEYLFYCGLHIAEDANLLGIRQHLDGPSVLMTGSLGEIWYTETRYPRHTISAALKRWDSAGVGMGEWRLEAGFIQLAVPYLGARRREDIFRITHSGELEKWRLNIPYDRPLPRRIAEEAGVPREMFGQRKLASVVNLPFPSMPRDPGLRAEFFDYLAGKRLCSRLTLKAMPLILKYNAALVYYTPRNQYRALYYLERLLAALLRDDKFRLPRLLRHLDGALFGYCVNKRAQEYRQMLGR